MTLTPAVTGTLNTGAAVTLQASNDITITSAITADNPGGNGGNLTLQAGRSLLINANITTDNGNLTLTANDTVANGVVDADRDSGSAVITQAGGTTLDVGTGTLTINLRNSTDKTYNDRGVASFQDLSAGSIVLNVGSLTANSIFCDTLTIAPGATISINAIPGGRQAARPLHNSLTKSLANGAVSPIASVITDQATETSPVAQSPLAATPVAAGPLAACTIIASPVSATSEAATMVSSSSSLSNTVLDAVAAPTEKIADIALPVGLVETTPAKLIDTAIGSLPLQSPIYSWFDSTPLPKIIENWLEQSLTSRNENITSTPILGSLSDEFPSHVSDHAKHPTTPVINNRQAKFAAFESIVQNPHWIDTDAEAALDISPTCSRWKTFQSV